MNHERLTILTQVLLICAGLRQERHLGHPPRTTQTPRQHTVSTHQTCRQGQVSTCLSQPAHLRTLTGSLPCLGPLTAKASTQGEFQRAPLGHLPTALLGWFASAQMGHLQAALLMLL